jgi:hypothetical protein
MPIERREITLLPTELVDAVASYLRMSQSRYPQGRIVAVNPEQTQAGPVVHVEVNPPNCGDQIVTTQIHPPAALEMFVRFCNENNIPLPRSGRKLLRANGGSLAMLIVMDNGAITA